MRSLDERTQAMRRRYDRNQTLLLTLSRLFQCLNLSREACKEWFFKGLAFVLSFTAIGGTLTPSNIDLSNSFYFFFHLPRNSEVCSVVMGCAECSLKPYCVWCPEEKLCMPGGFFGISNNVRKTKCRDWRWLRCDGGA